MNRLLFNLLAGGFSWGRMYTFCCTCFTLNHFSSIWTSFIMSSNIPFLLMWDKTHLILHSLCSGVRIGSALKVFLFNSFPFIRRTSDVFGILLDLERLLRFALSLYGILSIESRVVTFLFLPQRCFLVDTSPAGHSGERLSKCLSQILFTVLVAHLNSLAHSPRHPLASLPSSFWFLIRKCTTACLWFSVRKFLFGVATGFESVSVSDPVVSSVVSVPSVVSGEPVDVDGESVDVDGESGGGSEGGGELVAERLYSNQMSRTDFLFTPKCQEAWRYGHLPPSRHRVYLQSESS